VRVVRDVNLIAGLDERGVAYISGTSMKVSDIAIDATT